MDEQHSVTLRKALACDCGTFAPNAEQMRMHLAEGRCIPSESQLYILRERIRAIALERERLATRFVSLGHEESLLESVLRSANTGTPARPREETRNQRIAREAQERAKASKDYKFLKAAKGDAGRAAILKELFGEE